MQAFIVSDLHLGSTESQHEAFTAFLHSLPEGATLVLNGDVVNDVSKLQPRQAERDAALTLLAQVSHERPVIWLSGNNDETFRPDDPGAITFTDAFTINHTLFVCHGHRFLALPSWTRGLQCGLSRLCTRLYASGKQTFHTSAFLRRAPMLYRMVCSRLAHAATRFARKQGYEAIACGHTHVAQSRTLHGVRFFNTGSWTDATTHVLVVNGQTMELLSITELTVTLSV